MFTHLKEHPSLKKGLGALLLVVSVALIGFLLFALGQDLSLWVFGQSTTGQVIDSWAEAMNEGEQEELYFRYFVHYRFSTPKGQVIVSTKPVSAQEWVGVGHGGRGQGGADFYSGEAVGASAPVYQEQEHLSEFTEGGLLDAPEVAVVYFPLYPAHNRLEESRYVPLLACTYMPLLVVAGMSFVAARHLLRGGTTWRRWRLGQMASLSKQS
jgi:hypothetical protein